MNPQQNFVKKVANTITRLGLTAPAVFLLEAHKPLAFIGSQFLLVAQPTVDLFFPRNATRNLADLLADPTRVDQLIAMLESNPAPGLFPANLETKTVEPEHGAATYVELAGAAHCVVPTEMLFSRECGTATRNENLVVIPGSHGIPMPWRNNAGSPGHKDAPATGILLSEEAN